MHTNSCSLKGKNLFDLEGVVKYNDLKIVYTNCRSLCNKLGALELCIFEEKPNLVALSETWFSPDSELNIEGYHGYYCSRKSRRGGGVAIYIENSILNRTQLIKLDIEYSFNAVIIKVNLCSSDITVAVFYRPPNLSLHETIAMYDIIKSLVGKDIIIMGDFNLPGIVWATQNLSENCSKPVESNLFIEVINDLFLYQHVNKPTRCSGCENSIVDLIFTKDQSFIRNLCINPPLKGSDHMIMTFNYKIPFYHKRTEVVYLYSKINDALVYDIIKKWNYRFTFDRPIDQLWRDFMSMFGEIRSCVPEKRICVRKGSSYLNNSGFRLAIKQKHGLSI